MEQNNPKHDTSEFRGYIFYPDYFKPPSRLTDQRLTMLSFVSKLMSQNLFGTPEQEPDWKRTVFAKVIETIHSDTQKHHGNFPLYIT